MSPVSTVAQVRSPGGKRHILALLLGLVATFLTWSTAALAQLTTEVVNPRSADFDLPADERSDVIGYWLEVFPRGSETTSAPALKATYLKKSPPANKGGLRIDFGTALDGLADGEYVATLRAVSQTGQSPRSAPSEPFAVTGRASRPSSPGAVAARSTPTEPPPQPAPIAAEAKPDDEPRSRWWSVAFVVGIVIGVLATTIF
jgi:hypothetical protein